MANLPSEEVDGQYVEPGLRDDDPSYDDNIALPEGHPETEHSDEEDERPDVPPLLFVDINMDEGQSERIVVYEGDTATELARKFCRKHGLDEETRQRLVGLLQQQINATLPKIEENEYSSDEDNLTY